MAGTEPWSLHPSAETAVERSLARIATEDGLINSFTHLCADRAREQARGLDRRRAQGEALPPLVGVTFAVKNLFDVAGLTTLAGSALEEGQPPAARDAVLVQRLTRAGAILLGTLNMDTYAYGFTTENTHFGATRNPHDPGRTCGGSSGGSGAAVAAGFVGMSLGSDTNGSIRVPASLCGTFGLKPTYGRLPRTGTYPFVNSLDHVGPLAESSALLSACYDVLQGHDGGDPGCLPRPIEPTVPTLHAGIAGLRVARLGGYFDQYAGAEAREASRSAAEVLGATATIDLPEVHRARAAAFLLTATEGGSRHLERAGGNYARFEPHSRDRFLAGAITPSAWYLQAQRLRSWFRAQLAAVFGDWDLLVAPATPCGATLLGEDWLDLGGERLPLRPSMGMLTQPLSFAGLPVAVAPLWPGGALPIGVQLIAPPWREDLCLRAAAWLERQGLARCPRPEAVG